MQTVVDYSIVKTVVADWLYVNKTELKWNLEICLQILI